MKSNSLAHYYLALSNTALELSYTLAIQLANKLVKLYTISKKPRAILTTVARTLAYKTLPEALLEKIKSSKLARSVFLPSSPNRYFIIEHMSISSFFLELKKREIRYSILRWWESLPDIQQNEDIDILIDDLDFARIQDLITKKEGQIKLDFYSVYGSNGLRYGETLYFPTTLSTATLDSSEYFNEIFRVPKSSSYKSTLAFHALFHKGADSLIPGFHAKANAFQCDHDYSELLVRLNKSKIKITKNNLLKQLELNGYLPDPDAYSKYAELNSQTFELMPPIFQDARGGEISLFIIRENAILNNELASIKQTIQYHFKMELLHEIELNEIQKKYLKCHMRGANWSKGPYNLSGGDPAYLILAYDYHPSPLSDKAQRTYPFFSNGNLLKCKNSARNSINKYKLLNKQYNPLHTTDNEREVLGYLPKILPEKDIHSMMCRVNFLRDAYKTHHPIKKVISCGRRSKVELIYFEGKLAVKKTFRPSASAFLENELTTYTEMRSLIPQHLPELLERGQNYFITEYLQLNQYNNKKTFYKKLKKHEADVFGIIKAFHSKGYAFINFIPDNTAIDTDGNLKIFDFEFVQKYQGSTPSLYECYELQGTPSDFDGVLPEGKYARFNSYRFVWKPVFNKKLIDFYRENVGEH